MRKIFLAAALFLLLFNFRPSPTYAQSPLNCGLLNERCCNLAGGPPNSCQTGLECRGGTCVASPTTTNPPRRGATPSPVSSTNAQAGDITCTPSGGKADSGINTAIGCIPINDTNAFIGFILRWAIGIGGGIAFLLIVYAGFMIMSSSGNPERLKAGQELMTSAIAGLIMLIFSIFILRVIGVDILGLGKFGLGQ